VNVGGYYVSHTFFYHEPLNISFTVYDHWLISRYDRLSLDMFYDFSENHLDSCLYILSSQKDLNIHLWSMIKALFFKLTPLHVALFIFGDSLFDARNNAFINGPTADFWPYE
jgi:hypothetical protein